MLNTLELGRGLWVLYPAPVPSWGRSLLGALWCSLCFSFHWHVAPGSERDLTHTLHSRGAVLLGRGFWSTCSHLAISMWAWHVLSGNQRGLWHRHTGLLLRHDCTESDCSRGIETRVSGPTPPITRLQQRGHLRAPVTADSFLHLGWIWVS